MSQPVGAKYWRAQSLLTSPLDGPALRCPYNGHLWGEMTWTGTPTGTFVLQARVAGGPWFDVPGAAPGFASQPAGAAQATPQPFNFVNMPGDEFRFRYTGAGAGTVTLSVGFGDSQESW